MRCAEESADCMARGFTCEVTRVRLRANLQSGAVKSEGASAPTLHHEVIMMLREGFYLFVLYRAI